MPEDKFNELKMSIRVPVWLSGNRTWYVRATGNNNNLNDIDKGRDNNDSSAFKTIQAAINFVADNFNVSTFTATISIGPGTYAAITLPKYNSTTGSILLQGSGEDTVLTATDTTVINSIASAGTFHIRNMRIDVRNESSSNTIFPSAIIAQEGVVLNLQDLALHPIEGPEAGGQIRTIQCLGRVSLRDNVVITSEGKASGSKIIIFYITGGNVTHVGSGTVTTVNGTGYLNMNITNIGFFGRNIAYTPTPTFAGNFVGINLRMTLLSGCATAGAGMSYFPGTITGAIDSSSYLS
jgi:hypothetical protein